MFKFDFVSFLIGLLVAFGISALLYRQRVTVSGVRARLTDRGRRLRDRLTANIESRYQAALLARLDQLHLAQRDAPFDQLYIDQRFAAPPTRPTLAPIDPALLEPVRLSAALRSSPRLTITGASGTGRTTLLSQIARLHLAHQAMSVLGLEHERLPVYIHLAEMDWLRANEIDPLSAITQGTALQMPRLIASNVSKLIASRLRADAVLLLLDGFDDLTPGQRITCVNWLAALIKRFPNMGVIIVTGPAGYGPLQNLGCAPLQLAAWTPDDVKGYAQKWIDAIKGGKQDHQLLASGLRQLGGLTPRPIDLALAAGDWRNRSALPPTRSAAFDQWLDRALQTDSAKSRLPVDKIKAILAHTAWLTYQNNRPDFTFDQLEQVVAGAMQPATPAEPTKLAEQVTEAARDIVDRVQLLLPFGADGWCFLHRDLGAYLAAWHAVQTSAALDSYWDQPEWADVMDHCAALLEPADLVNRQLSAPDDLSRSRLWAAARWTGHAKPEAAWRSRVMGELARTLVQPDQLTPLRERALSGLLDTRDKGLAYLLKRTLAHPDASVRAMSLRGLSHLEREADLPLFVAALNDSALEVRLAAVRAVGFIARGGSTAAIEQLIKLLLEQDEDTRRLAAELLAQCGAEGHQILREGVGEDDLKVRRAAAYGLAATGEPWARELLRKLERDDTQWFVRSAATDALGLMKLRERQPQEDPVLDLSPLNIEQQGWLVEWAARQGIGIGVGRQATAALMRALDEGDAPVRLAALQTLRHMGDLAHHDKLRALLYDPDKSVREGAFAALEAIGRRAGQALPR